MEEDGSAYNLLTGTPTGKRTLGTPRHRWEDNIRTDLKEIDCNMNNSLVSTQDMNRTIVDEEFNLLVSLVI